jgi:hypothetical protein
MHGYSILSTCKPVFGGHTCGYAIGWRRRPPTELRSVVFDRPVSPSHSLARSLLEWVCKHILDDSRIAFNNDSELPALYNEVTKPLNLAPAQHEEVISRPSSAMRWPL